MGAQESSAHRQGGSALEAEPLATAAVVTVLGAFRVRVAGRDVGARDWTHGSAQRLAKLLFVTPRHRLRREAAADILWPDASSERGAANLRRAIYFLERALTSSGCPSVLDRGGRSVGLAPHVMLDLDLDRAQAALTRLRGLLIEAPDAEGVQVAAAAREALGFVLEDLLPDDLDEPWIVAPRTALIGQWEAVMLEASGRLAAANVTGLAHEIVERVLAADRGNEEAHRQTIELYARRGLRYAAQQQYVACVQALRDLYSVEPSPRTVQVMAELATPRR